jgi:hypothetical protein
LRSRSPQSNRITDRRFLRRLNPSRQAPLDLCNHKNFIWMACGFLFTAAELCLVFHGRGCGCVTCTSREDLPFRRALSYATTLSTSGRVCQQAAFISSISEHRLRHKPGSRGSVRMSCGTHVPFIISEASSLWLLPEVTSQAEARCHMYVDVRHGFIIPLTLSMV